MALLSAPSPSETPNYPQFLVQSSPLQFLWCLNTPCGLTNKLFKMRNFLIPALEHICLVTVVTLGRDSFKLQTPTVHPNSTDNNLVYKHILLAK